jgi:hypothetical protein
MIEIMMQKLPLKTFLNLWSFFNIQSFGALKYKNTNKLGKSAHKSLAAISLKLRFILTNQLAIKMPSVWQFQGIAS